MIDVRGLDITFGHGARAFAAVRGATFSVASGESFGLVGESGSGKTTVLRALAGLLDGIASVGGEMTVGGERLFHDDVFASICCPDGNLVMRRWRCADVDHPNVLPFEERIKIVC